MNENDLSMSRSPTKRSEIKKQSTLRGKDLDNSSNKQLQSSAPNLSEDMIQMIMIEDNISD